jgi:hypothetical protein
MELKVEHKPFPEHKYNKVIKAYLIDQILYHEYSFRYNVHYCTVPTVQYKDNKVSKEHFTYTNYGYKTKIDSASRLC